jgi:predicted HTH domain antitoxin
MSQVTFDLPTASLLALKVQPAQAADEIRMAAAVKWYEMGRISSGAAAQLAGVARTVVLARLADYGVDTFRLSKEQLQREAVLKIAGEWG